ncbi:MAG: Asp-tRNA(Asn)/Glu-tRNA(Gln) amidotransferase GatCAB subunit A [Rickettsiales bacterium]|nr:Asp-tRNA(Asn)/Glu-tRNA(Gln) amidotransferase GatCAB subunit A [Rickettsiales bacterium]
MKDFDELDITSAKENILKKRFSSVELTKYFIGKIEDNKNINCYITETPEIALNMAKKSDEKISKGFDLGLLEGIPIGMKDLFCTNGVKTTAGSKILENFIPFYESTVSKNLWDNGAVMLGKTNMDEFAMGSANTTSFYGNVLNPLRENESEKNLVPGGSSGGSAAAVASGQCLGATGSDTGGSIRQPASFCGLVGLKPTYGRCSRFGMVAFASSLDQAGPLTKSVNDSALMLQAMSGFDEKDSTSSRKEIPNFLEYKDIDLRKLKIGLPKEYIIDGLNSEIKRCWENSVKWFKENGSEIIDINLPHTQFALPTYYIIAPAEASANLARYDGVRYGFREKSDDLLELYECTRSSGFGDEVRRRLMIGTYVLSAGYYDAYYLKALKVRKLIFNDFMDAFRKCDLILTPTTPNVAFGIGEKQNDPIEMYLNDVLTVPASLAGLPAISVSGGMNDKDLPIGLQLIGKPFDELSVLAGGKFVEDFRGF